MESLEPLVSIKFHFYTYLKVFLLGRHCCLWCTITSDQLIVPKASRQPVTVRTLDHLSEKYSEFVADGGNLKKAKFHCNVIGETLFNIPLTQVMSERSLLTLYTCTCCRSARQVFILHLASFSAYIPSLRMSVTS